MIRRFAFAALVFFLAAFLCAQESWSDEDAPFIGEFGNIWIEGTFGIAAGSSLAFDRIILGGQVAWIFAPPFGVEFDVYYGGTNYYLWNGSEWSGPLGWSSIQAAYPGMSPSEWSFSETEIVVGLCAAARVELGDGWFAHFALGPAATVIVPSEAIEYYPEFRDMFEGADRSNVFVGWFVKAGFRYSRNSLSLGLDWIFDVRSPEDFLSGVGADGLLYFLYSGSFSIVAGVVL